MHESTTSRRWRTVREVGWRAGLMACAWRLGYQRAVCVRCRSRLLFFGSDWFGQHGANAALIGEDHIGRGDWIYFVLRVLFIGAIAARDVQRQAIADGIAGCAGQRIQPGVPLHETGVQIVVEEAPTAAPTQVFGDVLARDEQPATRVQIRPQVTDRIIRPIRGVAPEGHGPDDTAGDVLTEDRVVRRAAKACVPGIVSVALGLQGPGIVGAQPRSIITAVVRHEEYVGGLDERRLYSEGTLTCIEVGITVGVRGADGIGHLAARRQRRGLDTPDTVSGRIIAVSRHRRTSPGLAARCHSMSTPGARWPYLSRPVQGRGR